MSGREAKAEAQANPRQQKPEEPQLHSVFEVKAVSHGGWPEGRWAVALQQLPPQLHCRAVLQTCARR